VEPDGTHTPPSGPWWFKRPCQRHQMTLLPPATSECLAALIWHKAELGRQPHPPTPAAQSQRAKLRQRLSAAPSINCSGFFCGNRTPNPHWGCDFLRSVFRASSDGFWRRTWGIWFKYETRRVLGVSFCSSNGQTRVLNTATRAVFPPVRRTDVKQTTCPYINPLKLAGDLFLRSAARPSAT